MKANGLVTTVAKLIAEVHLLSIIQKNIVFGNLSELLSFSVVFC